MGVVVSRLRSKNNLILCLTALCVGMGLLMPSSVFAQARQGLLLNAGLSVQSDSNITRTTEKTSDKLAIFSPQLQFLSNIGQHKFVFDYQGDFASYNDNSQYNYNDHALNLSAQFDHSYRLRSAFSLSYQNQVEAPGSNNAQTQLSNEFNQFTRKSALAKFYYGANASTGQLVFGLEHNQRRYSNNNQDFRDTDVNNLTATFFYRIAPKTRLLFETIVRNFYYVSENTVRDQSSSENLYLAGAEWKATATTSGKFRIGYQSKNFDNEQFSDFNGLSYFLDMYWRPSNFTNVKFAASREPSESAQQDVSGFVKQVYLLAIEHALSERTIVSSSYQSNKSDISAAVDRNDVRNSINVGISHSLHTWLDIGLAYRHLTKSSNDEIFAFSSNAVELTLTTHFE